MLRQACTWYEQGTAIQTVQSLSDCTAIDSPVDTDVCGVSVARIDVGGVDAPLLWVIRVGAPEILSERLFFFFTCLGFF